MLKRAQQHENEMTYYYWVQVNASIKIRYVTANRNIQFIPNHFKSSA